MKKIKKFFSDFKAFTTKGNVVDLAVAVIIGAAFGKIVTSLVNDMIMPLITGALGARSLADLSFIIRPAILENGVVVKEALTVKWGNFLQNIVDFLIISFVVFSFIRLLNAAKSAASKLADNAKELLEKAVKEKEHAEEQAKEAEEKAQTAEVKTETVTAPAAPDMGNTDTLKHIEALLTDIRNAINKQA